MEHHYSPGICHFIPQLRAAMLMETDDRYCIMHLGCCCSHYHSTQPYPGRHILSFTGSIPLLSGDLGWEKTGAFAFQFHEHAPFLPGRDSEQIPVSKELLTEEKVRCNDCSLLLLQSVY